MRLLLIATMLAATAVLLFLTFWFWDLDFLWPCAPLIFIACMAGGGFERSTAPRPDRSGS